MNTVLLITYLLCETGCVVEGVAPTRLEPLLPDDADETEVQQAQWIDRMWDEHTVSVIVLLTLGLLGWG